MVHAASVQITGYPFQWNSDCLATGHWSLWHIPVWVQRWQHCTGKRSWAHRTSFRTESRGLNIVGPEAGVSLAALLSPLISTKATKNTCDNCGHLRRHCFNPTRCPSCLSQQNMPRADNTSVSVKYKTTGDSVSCDPQIRIWECNGHLLRYSCWTA